MNQPPRHEAPGGVCSLDCDDRAERLEGELRGLSAENQRLRTEREGLRAQVAILESRVSYLEAAIGLADKE